MDAKKAAKFKKPFQFTKTKAFKAINLVFAGLIGYTVLSTFLFNEYFKRRPFDIRDNVIDKYFQSEEYRLQVERAKGRAPPSRKDLMEFWDKYGKDLHYYGSRPSL